MKADELMGIERYSHVMHIVSNVVGKLARGSPRSTCSARRFRGDGLQAPRRSGRCRSSPNSNRSAAGSTRGGGVFRPAGSMDFCIAIRTIVMSGEAMIQAGAGIVADSDPAREWDEILIKAKILFRAVGVSPETLEAP